MRVYLGHAVPLPCIWGLRNTYSSQLRAVCIRNVTTKWSPKFCQKCTQSVTGKKVLSVMFCTKVSECFCPVFADGIFAGLFRTIVFKFLHKGPVLALSEKIHIWNQPWGNLLSIQVARRISVLYVCWMLVGFGTFVYITYYPLLMEEPVLQLESDVIVTPLYLWWVQNRSTESLGKTHQAGILCRFPARISKMISY